MTDTSMDALAQRVGATGRQVVAEGLRFTGRGITIADLARIRALGVGYRVTA